MFGSKMKKPKFRHRNGATGDQLIARACEKLGDAQKEASENLGTCIKTEFKDQNKILRGMSENLAAHRGATERERKT